MFGKSQPLLSLAVIFAVVVGLGFSAALGQSGRRAPKSKTVSPPVQEPAPTPSPSPAKLKSQVAVRFILGMDEIDNFSSLSLSAISGIKRSCAQRLGERAWIRVTSAPRPMVRSEAIKLAKAEQDSYVIWLRARVDSMSGRQAGAGNNAFIEFVVYAPQTAKIVVAGSTYPASRGNVILERRPSDIDGDYYLNRAARETADKILSKFSSIAPRQPLAAGCFRFPVRHKGCRSPRDTFHRLRDVLPSKSESSRHPQSLVHFPAAPPF